MVFHVLHIIFGNEFNRKCAPARIAPSKVHPGGHALQDKKDLPVVCGPECDQVFFVGLLVKIILVPPVLVVLDLRYFLELRAHEPVMIIGGAVDQVTQDLFFAPSPV
jgi:hypothetical protein